MNLDKRLLNQAKKLKPLLIFTILLGITVAICTIGQAKFLSNILSQVFLDQQALKDVFPLLILFGLFSLFRAFFHWGQQNIASKIASEIKLNLRNRLNNHLFGLGPFYTKSQRTGELSNTLLKGIDSLEAYFSQYLPQLFLSALIPVIILLFVFPLDILTGIVFLFTAPLIPIFMVLIGNQTETLTKRQWKTLSRLSSHFLDVVQGLTTLKIFNRSKEQIQIIAKISNDYRLATMKVLKVAFLSALSLEILATISTAIIAVEVGLRLLYAKMDFESAIFILILAPEFYLPLRLLGTRFHAGMEGVSAAKGIFEILETRAPILRKESETISLKNNIIRFEEVSFMYSTNKKNALDNVSFKISPNQKTALVGPSGSGKTTLTNLLLAFLQPTAGNIFFGKDKLQNLSRESWRKNISWVPQNPYLFNTSIAENLLLANPKASQADLIEATKFANIYKVIKSFTDGFNTTIGERGTRLSGGEAQRIALARAYLKNAPLVIFDEPTANLDPENEQMILNAIQKLMANKTVVTIAHRLNTVKNYDQIIILANGQIKENGNHFELIKQRGIYYKLTEAYKGNV